SSRKKIVKITIFMTDIADYPVINEVYTEFFQGHGILPARSALQVAALPKPEAKVEIEAIGRLEA
ncbi:RidA family protein, partial [bacterium]|nr:RidA family protein [bacterium]